MKTFRILILLLFFSSFAYGQNYEKAVGLRFGLHNGLSYKQFVTHQTAIEGIIVTRWHGWEIVGLLEYNNELDSNGSLVWFYGFGGHLGSYSSVYTHWDGTTESYMVIGVDGILGIEYKFDNIPLAVGLDWKPYFNIIGYSRFFGDGGGLSVRYTF